ncbi:MAG: Integral rane protein TerC [Verrucomicrobia bacterium]|nr:Integral rane protein TerC [Verrucomicrobiota bacterium]
MLRAMPPTIALFETMPFWAWAAFFGFIVAMLALDLGLLQRTPHAVSMKEALGWCAVWAVLALGFNGLLYFWRGAEPAQQFLAGYLVELCLSVDNVFVFILVFAYFRVPARFQHRVLFWGIIGAVVMRAVFILVGVGVIQRFHWVLYIFGVFLIYTGARMALPQKDEEIHPDRNFAVKLFRRFFPVSSGAIGGTFFVREGGRRLATPLFIVLIVIETTDLVFALDSLPAVLAITKDGFIALTSNIFAILGLRSLYFALNGVMQLFRYLKIGLAIILVFIGTKMLIVRWADISTATSLGVIGGVLAMSVLVSVLVKDTAGPRETPKI